jgi:hypothetical protein
VAKHYGVEAASRVIVKVYLLFYSWFGLMP